jgi:hypothetical protein
MPRPAGGSPLHLLITTLFVSGGLVLAGYAGYM